MSAGRFRPRALDRLAAARPAGARNFP